MRVLSQLNDLFATIETQSNKFVALVLGFNIWSMIDKGTITFIASLILTGMGIVNQWLQIRKNSKK